MRKLFYQVWEPDDFAGGKPGRESAVVIKLPRYDYDEIIDALDPFDITVHDHLIAGTGGVTSLKAAGLI